MALPPPTHQLSTPSLFELACLSISPNTSAAPHSTRSQLPLPSSPTPRYRQSSRGFHAPQAPFLSLRRRSDLLVVEEAGWLRTAHRGYWYLRGTVAMGKKRAAAVSATPVLFPTPAAAPEPEADHFSDYGFDPQLLHFFSQPEVKRLWGRRQRQHQHQPAQLKPLESARFKLQKPISKKHHHRPQKQQQRRRWWSSAASAALHLFKKRRPSSTSARPAAAPTAPYGPATSAAVPLYLADYDAGGDDAACSCWAPAVRSGRLAAAELGAAALAVPYVSLRPASLGAGGGGTGAGGAPVMPIYLVT